MIMPIVIYGSPILRKKSFDIEKPDEIISLAENMMQTLKDADGLGLAGPQVGALKNLFVINTSPLESEGVQSEEKVFINPEILNYSDNNVYYNEGCLSIPGIFEDVSRPEAVEVRYRDLNFDWHEETLDGTVARIFQHEYDHLLGTLFIDKLSAIRRKLLRNKLNQIRKKNYIVP
ncbi:peptide deformylase [Mariniphaga sediminis]|jgi:peptide deformylase|uniref:Peptide deformylase n=2 Tax=Mariniphaga sediminis TaxID=1628158 RepID=A0A399D7B6_9BACT|nr:peptide deformylase [Mariniphaga sediminis]